MNSLDNKGGTPYLLIPRGRQGLAPLSLDMTEVYRIERRIEEIRNANPETMPDLITEFTIGFIQVGKMVSCAQLELADAKMSLSEAKAIATLDRAEKVLAEKGVKSTADSREAVLALDPDVQSAQHRVAAIDACLNLLYNKLSAFEWSYQSVKKIGDIQSRMPGAGGMVGRSDNR